MLVKAKKSFVHAGFLVNVGEVGELYDTELKDALAAGNVTQDLNWKPGQPKAIALADFTLHNGTKIASGEEFDVEGPELTSLIAEKLAVVAKPKPVTPPVTTKFAPPGASAPSVAKPPVASPTSAASGGTP
jgi:hypothetical protein